MSKRHVASVSLSEILSALASDIVSTFPELALDCERTVRRLELALVERGPGVFYTELPQLAKHLDRCLDVGLYSQAESHLAFSGQHSPSDLLPEIWNGLWGKIFDKQSGLLLLGGRDLVCSIKLLRQALCLWKKVDVECPDSARRDTILSFVSTDNSLPDVPDVWGKDCVGWDERLASPVFWERVDAISDLPVRTRNKLRTTLAALSAATCSALGPYNPGDHDFRHGPGAVASTLPRSKYSWTNWSDRLDTVFPISECGFSSTLWWADSAFCGLSVDELSLIGNEDLPSRMVSVPKTFKGPRLIACEPAEMQWCQQNIWSYLQTRVSGTWLGDFIRFRDQSQNQELCIAGSRDGSLATIDLSDASDRVTPGIVSAVFGRNPGLVLALRATRTRSVTLPDDLGIHVLKKFSTMGSACTFPVESIVFLVVALATCLVLDEVEQESSGVGIPRGASNLLARVRSLRGRVSVFGDDIIVPTDKFRTVCSVLEALCFKVSHTKSFSGKFFRESCGTDAVLGEVVTPIYWRKLAAERPEDLMSISETHENLHRAGYVNLARLAQTTISGVLTPRSGSSKSLGVYSPSLIPFCPERPDLPEGMPHDLISHRYRWNRALQRVEVRVRKTKTKVKRVRTSGHVALLQYFTEKPSPLSKWEAGFTLRSHTRVVWDWEDVYAQFGPEMGRCAEIIGISRCR